MSQEQEAFLERLGALDSRLAVARHAIDAGEIDERLRARAAGDLRRRLDDQIERVATQRNRIRDYGFKPAAWQTLRAYSDQCGPLFAECLAFVQGGTARALDPDQICPVADALLDALANDIPNVKWGRFSVLASEEFFVDLVQIVRVRFPTDGIWDLPVAAHELGHFIAGRLNRQVGAGHELPFEIYKAGAKGQDGQSDESWRAFLDEYFADVYATYALGPAYACSCLLLRFDPAKASAETDGIHPAFSKRAYVILQTLRRMNQEKDTAGHFAIWAENLKGSWHAAMAAAGQRQPWPTEADEPAAPNTTRTRVDGVVSAFYEMLKSAAPAARYNHQVQANAAAALLSNPARPLTPHAYSIAELLNAAWIRRGAGDAPDGISTFVLQLCRL